MLPANSRCNLQHVSWLAVHCFSSASSFGSYIDSRLVSSDDMSIKELLTLAHAVDELSQEWGMPRIEVTILAVALYVLMQSSS